jgi:excisionase family DNA binding protein
MGKDMLSAAQAAEFLGISVTILRRHARDGVIPGKKEGRRWFFLKAELESWLKSGVSQVSLDRDESPWGPGN